MIDVVEMLGDRKIEAHSSIVLTYALDLVFYDGFVRRQLRAAGASNQIVFCDAGRYEHELASLDSARHLGKAYSLTPVHQNAAFHPKIYLLLGPERGQLLIGSGNATLGGLTRNAELFGAFDFDARNGVGPHPAFASVMSMVRKLVEKASPFVRLQFERAEARSGWLRLPPVDDGRKLLIGGPGHPPMLEQLRSAIGPGRIDHVLVCSASFDRRLRGLESLAEIAVNGRVTCLVQPDLVTLDGAAVKRLGKKVEWKSLTLTHLRRKAENADTFSHAKMLVFTIGDSECTAYGSANASAPALLGDNESNTEIVVLLAPAKRGTIMKKLSLGPSLESSNAYGALCQHEWPADEPKTKTTSGQLLLSGVSVDQGKVTSTFSSPPRETKLRLALGLSPPPMPAVGEITVVRGDGDHWVGTWSGDVSAIRVGWITDVRSKPLSNAVAVTWRDVADAGSRGGWGERADEAIAAMQDGQVITTALYALLEDVSDYKRGHAHLHEELDGDGKPETVHPRSQESFYSDRVIVSNGSAHLSADRMDLDLLGSLLRPLATSAVVEPDEEWFPNEEAERRRLDASGSGEEEWNAEQGEASPNDGTALEVSAEKIEKSARRLSRRLDRAASVAEDLLGIASNVPIPTGAIARQLWMTHIAAFLAGRDVPTKDGPISALSADVFARYVIRMAHALSGGKKGGLLARLPATAWTGHDGENLRRGLAFNWTCVIWAAAYLRRYWETVAERTENAKAIAEAIPELVAARFALMAAEYCGERDENDMAKRLPAFGVLTTEDRANAAGRLKQLVSLIRKHEKNPPRIPSSLPMHLEPGALVYNAGLGVTVALKANSAGIQLVDLSRAVRLPNRRAGRSTAKDFPYMVNFLQMVAPIDGAGAVSSICCRPPEELIELWERMDT